MLGRKLDQDEGAGASPQRLIREGSGRVQTRDLEEVRHVWGEVFQAEGMEWIKMQWVSAHRDVLAQGW